MTMAAFENHRWVDRGLFADLAALYRQRGLAWQLFRAGIAEQRRANGLGMAGPFVSLLLHVVVLGTVMSLVLGEETHEFIPYFAISFAVWLALAGMLSHFADANDRAMRYLPFPNVSGYVVHLIDAYDFAVGLLLRLVAVLLVVAAVNPSILLHANYPGMLLGLVLATLAGFAWSVAFSFLFDRVRVLRAFLPQILLMVSLVTPLFWKVERLGAHRWIADYNPVFHLIEVVREPMLDGGLPYLSLAWVAAMALVGAVVTALIYRANREQMVYRWLA